MDTASLPALEWLDIDLQSDSTFDFHIIDAAILRGLPTALPSLKQLCLSKCIHDAHVEAFMPVVGQHLTRLELVSCMDHSDDEENIDYDFMPMKLTDRSASAIAQNCKKLESFSFVESEITTSGLQSVISNNQKITTLNISNNGSLGDNAVDVIARFLPRLKELRNYWPTSRSRWLTDDSLISDQCAGKTNRKRESQSDWFVQ
ncbi:hypothetical protein ACHAWC_007695 [Mediolabrus comicus]